MTIRKILIATLMLVCLPAFAQMATVVDAVETTPNNIILPATINGMVTFKPCVGECDKEHKRARLTDATIFAIDGRAVKFDQFRRNFLAKSRSDESYALVSYELDTNTVTRIEISR